MSDKKSDPLTNMEIEERKEYGNYEIERTTMKSFFADIKIAPNEKVYETLRLDGYSTKEDLAEVIKTMQVNDLKNFGLTDKESRTILISFENQREKTDQDPLKYIYASGLGYVPYGFTGPSGPSGPFLPHPLSQSTSYQLFNRLINLAKATGLQVTENITTFDDWACNFISNLISQNCKLLVLDEVQRDLDFVDRFVTYLAKQPVKKLSLVLLGTPQQGCLKVEVGANIESRSACVNIPSLNVVEVYSLLSKYNNAGVLIDAWTLLNGNPGAYHDFNDIEVEFLPRQRKFLTYLRTSPPLPFIPNDILQDLNKISKPRSAFSQNFQENITKLITRNIIVTKVPFREYIKDRDCKQSHIGFASYFLTTAGDVQIKGDKLTNLSDDELGNFMKSHSGLALEDAYEDFYHWLILNHPNDPLPGLANSQAFKYTVLRNVSFLGVESDSDMVLELRDPTFKELVLFYIKKQASELFEEKGIKKFLTAFAQLPELQGYTLSVVLGYLFPTIFPTDWLLTWNTHAQVFSSVNFLISPSIVDFFSEISKYEITQVNGLLPRRYLHNQLNDVLKLKSIVRLQGRNQVGKTTFIQQFLLERTGGKYLEL